MKHVFILLATLLLIACNQDNGNAPLPTESELKRKTGTFETMEEFSSAIFELVAKDQYTQMADLLPELAEYKDIINSSSFEPDKKERIMKELENDVKRNIESLKRSYTRFKEATEQSGIDWTKSTLDFIDFNHRKEDKIELADIYLNFKYKGVNYKIVLKECVKYKDTWLLGSQINFIENGSTGYNRYDY